MSDCCCDPAPIRLKAEVGAACTVCTEQGVGWQRAYMEVLRCLWCGAGWHRHDMRSLIDHIAEKRHAVML